jgi:exocyst complex component 1
MAPQIYHEEEWIAEFLQVNDLSFTFAEYMNLENYYKRQAARTSGLSLQTIKFVRGGMDLIFMFLPAELKTWIDNALAKDNM